MKQQLQLSMQSPCHENWNSMTPTEQGRFCLSCQKEVIDFASMTDLEILQAIARAGSNMCGRVDDKQLQRIIQPPRQKKPRSLKYLWSMILGSALMTNRADGQSNTATAPVVQAMHLLQEADNSRIVVGKMTASPVAQQTIRINGTVTDEQGRGIAYATVLLEGTSQGVATDSSGRFVLELKHAPSGLHLKFSAVGMAPVAMSADSAGNIEKIAIEKNDINLTMKSVKLSAVTMEEVVVTQRIYGRLAGLMVAGIRVTNIEKAAIRFKDMLGTNQIKAYPNPIAAHGQFTLRLQLKTMGAYVIQLTDATGRIIASHPLTIVSANQAEVFNSSLLGAAGVYFASITHQQTLQTYTTRLLVQ